MYKHIVASQNSLQIQLASVSDTHATSSGEIQTLRHTLADVEREKRDLVAVVSRHKDDAAQQDGQSSRAFQKLCIHTQYRGNQLPP